jgi:hypothetical protein
MDFRAVQIMSMAVRTLVDELEWVPYGAAMLQTPLVQTDDDCHKLEVLEDIMGSLTRKMDTKINYVTSEGKIIKEWIETILEIGSRYRRELELLEKLEKGTALTGPDDYVSPS